MDGRKGRVTRDLTPREQEMMSMLCAGRRTADMAAVLGVTTSTVLNMRRHAYQKLRVTRHADACAELARRGAGERGSDQQAG